MSSRKKSKKIIPPIPCNWKECKLFFDDIWELNEHITSHFDELHQENKAIRSCPWIECTFETNNFMELKRHIYYHGYYTGLLIRGKYECEENKNIPKCKAPTKEFDKIPDLKYNFVCEWLDCQRTFVSIVEFHDHIIQHASFEYEIEKSPNDIRPKVKCKWSICNKLLENRYRLIEHILTHSNKKFAACQNCGEVFRTRTTLFDHLRRQPENNSKLAKVTFLIT